MLFAGPFEDDIDWKLIAGDARPAPGRALVAGPGVRGGGRGRRAGRRGASRRRSRGCTHRTIKGVTEDLERFRFNTAISKLMVLTNEMRSALDAGGGALGRGAPWRRCSRRSRRSPPRSCGGRCWGTGRRSTCRRGRAFDPALAVGGHGHAGRAGRRQGARQARGPGRHRTRTRRSSCARGADGARRALGRPEVVEGDRPRAQARELRHRSADSLARDPGHGRGRPARVASRAWGSGNASTRSPAGSLPVSSSWWSSRWPARASGTRARCRGRSHRGAGRCRSPGVPHASRSRRFASRRVGRADHRRRAGMVRQPGVYEFAAGRPGRRRPDPRGRARARAPTSPR